MWITILDMAVAKGVPIHLNIMFVKWIVRCLVFIFTGAVLYGQPVPEPEEKGRKGKNSDQFYRNPYEKSESQERREEYQKLYDEEISSSVLVENELLRQIFEPRVYDEVFDTNLPGRQRKGQWSLSLNPKFSDFVRDDYVRVPVGVRFSTSRWFEIFTDVGGYFGNPFEDGRREGFYNWKIGGKYSWVGVFGTGFNVASGVKANFPILDPPLELTDGYARYEPYVTVSRHLRRHPNWLVYLNTAYEFVDETPFDANPIQPRPRDRLFLRPGFIYYPGKNFRYTLELEYRTNALNDRNADSSIPHPGDNPPDGFREGNWILAHETVHEVIASPAITWFPTRKTRRGFRIPGNWDVGVRLELPIVEETGEDIGLSVRFRWYYDYRTFLARDLPSLFRNGD